MRYDLSCVVCGSGFASQNPSKMTCSAACLSERLRQQRIGKPTVTTVYRGRPILRNEHAASFKAYCLAAEFKLTLDDLVKIPSSSLLSSMGMWSTTNKHGVVRDHMYSRRQGFLSGVPAEIIGHPANCEFITMQENSRKADACSITLDHLYERIKSWNASPVLIHSPLTKRSQRTKHAPKHRKPKSYKQQIIYRNGETKIITANQFCAYQKCGWSRNSSPS